jgi:hypothetical protein
MNLQTDSKLALSRGLHASDTKTTLVGLLQATDQSTGQLFSVILYIGAGRNRSAGEESLSAVAVKWVDYA